MTHLTKQIFVLQFGFYYLATPPPQSQMNGIKVIGILLHLFSFRKVLISNKSLQYGEFGY